MIKSIIVDDEPNAVNFLANALTKYCMDVEIIGKAHSIEDALPLLYNSSFDLLFLDIELLDGSGFDLLERVGKINFSVIFITAYNQYAIRAFRFNALDYLLKPVNIKELLNAVDKVRIRLNASQQQMVDFRKLFENLKGPQPTKLAINSQSETVFISLDEIVRLEAYGNYTRVILVDGNQIIASKTLKEYETLLEDMSFFRVHHSHIINLQFIKKYIRRDGVSVLMQDGLSIPVATRRKEAFELYLKDFFNQMD